LEDAYDRIERLEKIRSRTVEENIAINTNKNFTKLVNKLKLGSNKLGKNKQEFEATMKIIMKQAENL
jgi:hypothetical protein